MSKKSILYLLIAICVSASVLSKSHEAYTRYTPVDEQPTEVVDAPTSVNMLLDNSMSSFAQAKTLDRDIEAFIRRWELKGASFALMRGDSLLYAKGYGIAKDSTAVDVNNVFRIASASKLITAVTIMRLAEQGRLSLNSQVFGAKGIICDTMFLDLYAKNLELITVDHLLRHTAGFSSPHGDPGFFNKNIANALGRKLPLKLDDMVEYATRNRLRTRPGGSYDYSNLGYMVLTKVIEEVTNQPYESFVRDSVLAPAGCYNMFIGRNFSENYAPNEVHYYEVKEAVPVEAYDGSGRMTMKSDGGNNVTLLSGAGGWVASPTELLRLVAAINGESGKPDILSKKSIEQMVHDSKTKHPIGWASVHGDQWLRSGSMAGTSALIKHQSDGYTWVFIANSSAWIGPRLSSYISSHISRAVAKVKEWPHRDLFVIEQVQRADSIDSIKLRDSVIIPNKVKDTLSVKPRGAAGLRKLFK